MKNETISEVEFLNQIEQLATSLSQGDNEKIFSLRKVVRSISVYEAASHWQKKNAVFILYFLNEFINDVWRNFGTDAPFEDITTIVSEISKQLGESLLMILPLIEHEKFDQSYMALNSLIRLYFDKLVYIETKLEKKYDVGQSISSNEEII